MRLPASLDSLLPLLVALSLAGFQSLQVRAHTPLILLPARLGAAVVHVAAKVLFHLHKLAARSYAVLIVFLRILDAPRVSACA
jgi:hypothetical protein